MELTGAASAPATATLLTIPGGIEGVKRTLALMVDITKTFRTDLNVRTLAIALTEGCGHKAKRCWLQALHRFVRDDIRYIEDVHNVETLQTPVQTLKLGAGDCDDKATLLASLAGSIGFATRFCAIGVNGEPFSHVMCQVSLGPGYLNAETIIPGVELGWFPPDATDVMLAHV